MTLGEGLIAAALPGSTILARARRLRGGYHSAPGRAGRTGDGPPWPGVPVRWRGRCRLRRAWRGGDRVHRAASRGVRVRDGGCRGRGDRGGRAACALLRCPRPDVRRQRDERGLVEHRHASGQGAPCLAGAGRGAVGDQRAGVPADGRHDAQPGLDGLPLQLRAGPRCLEGLQRHFQAAASRSEARGTPASTRVSSSASCALTWWTPWWAASVPSRRPRSADRPAGSGRACAGDASPAARCRPGRSRGRGSRSRPRSAAVVEERRVGTGTRSRRATSPFIRTSGVERRPLE